MKVRVIAWVAVVVAVVSAVPVCHAQVATTVPVMPSPALQQSVPVALERMHFSEGDNIVIREVRGAVASLEPGMTYAISGTYTLASPEQAAICAFVTAEKPSEGTGAVDAAQRIVVKKGEGTFTLTMAMREKGRVHVSFYPASGGPSSGDVFLEPLGSTQEEDAIKKERIEALQQDVVRAEELRKAGRGSWLEVSQRQEKLLRAQIEMARERRNAVGEVRSRKELVGLLVDRGNILRAQLEQGAGDNQSVTDARDARLREAQALARRIEQTGVAASPTTTPATTKPTVLTLDGKTGTSRAMVLECVAGNAYVQIASVSIGPGNPYDLDMRYQFVSGNDDSRLVFHAMLLSVDKKVIAEQTVTQPRRRPLPNVVGESGGVKYMDGERGPWHRAAFQFVNVPVADVASFHLDVTAE